MTVYHPAVKISVNNKDLSDSDFVVIKEVIVEEEINLPTMFSFSMAIYESEEGPWDNIDLIDFTLGISVEISMGLDTPKKIMSGEITAVDVSFSDSAYIEVRGYDKLHRLRFGKKRRSFTKNKDSQIVSTIAREEGLSADAQTTTTVHPYIFQNNQSNYAFLLERAQRIGYEIMVVDQKLIFRESKEKESPESGFQFAFGEDIKSLNIKLKSLPQGGEVEVRGWDMMKKEEFVGQAKKGSEAANMGGKESGHALSQSAIKSTSTAIVNQNLVDQKEATELAEAHYNTTLKEFIIGEGIYIGEMQIRAGKTIEISEIGTKFSGKYYVIATTHIIDENGYVIKFKVRKIDI